MNDKNKIEKKDYEKPEMSKNEPLTDITFGTAAGVGASLPGTAGSPGSVLAT